MKFSFSKTQKSQDIDRVFKEVTKEVKKRLKDRGYLISSKQVKLTDKDLINIWKILSPYPGEVYINHEVYCSNPALVKFFHLNSKTPSLEKLNLEYYDNKCKELRRKSSISIKSKSTISRKSVSSSSSSLKRKSTIK